MSLCSAELGLHNSMYTAYDNKRKKTVRLLCIYEIISILINTYCR